MNVELPDGQVIQDVPEGTTKAELVAKLERNGIKVPAEWKTAVAPAAPIKPEVSDLTVAGRGAGQGVTLGFADELRGLAGAGIEAISPSDKTDKRSILERLSGNYKDYRDIARDDAKVAEEANPALYNAAQIAGSVPTIIAGGIGGPASIAALSKPALSGAINAVGSSEADSALGIAGDAAKGAALAKLAGVGTQYTGKALHRLGGIGEKTTGLAEKSLDWAKNKTGDLASKFHVPEKVIEWAGEKAAKSPWLPRVGILETASIPFGVPGAASGVYLGTKYGGKALQSIGNSITRSKVRTAGRIAGAYAGDKAADTSIYEDIGKPIYDSIFTSLDSKAQPQNSAELGVEFMKRNQEDPGFREAVRNRTSNEVDR